MQIEKITNRTRILVDVAMGRVPADLVIRNGRWVCVQSGEIIPDSLISKMEKSALFNQGFAVVEYLATAYPPISS